MYVALLTNDIESAMNAAKFCKDRSSCDPYVWFNADEEKNRRGFFVGVPVHQSQLFASTMLAANSKYSCGQLYLVGDCTTNAEAVRISTLPANLLSSRSFLAMFAELQSAADAKTTQLDAVKKTLLKALGESHHTDLSQVVALELAARVNDRIEAFRDMRDVSNKRVEELRKELDDARDTIVYLKQQCEDAKQLASLANVTGTCYVAMVQIGSLWSYVGPWDTKKHLAEAMKDVVHTVVEVRTPDDLKTRKED